MVAEEPFYRSTVLWQTTSYSSLSEAIYPRTLGLRLLDRISSKSPPAAIVSSMDANQPFSNRMVSISVVLFRAWSVAMFIIEAANSLRSPNSNWETTVETS